MDRDLLSLLKVHKLFLSLDEHTLASFITKLIKIEINHGTILFSQGDPSDSVYLLVSGKLSIQLTTEQHNKTVGYIESGELVGELGALSNEPRAMTAKAVRDSVLYRIASNDFIELCYQHPSVMFATIHPVISRSQHIIHMLSGEQSTQHIVIVPANESALYHPFIEKFIQCVNSHPHVILVTEMDPDFQDITDPNRISEKIDALELRKKATQPILYLLTSVDSAFATICLKKADKVYIVADSNDKPYIQPMILDHIHNSTAPIKYSPDLVLLHPETTQIPSNTSAWLLQTQFHMHYHIRIDLMKHYQRLLRFMRGKAYGLVLGGGGTRGWAHLGVIKALREQKIPIDMVGGTSVGSIIGGCYAMTESYEESYEKFHEMVENSRRSISWRSVTWPIISLFDAKSFTYSQRHLFKDVEIEDLWLPYFCISSNLANYSEEVHRSGIIWERTRSSSSIPGIIPPMVINGELHLDGGLFNNLPVDIMRQYVGKKATVIAVELNSSLRDYHKYHFPPELSLKQAILIKLGLSHENYKFPRFIDTFLRGLMVGSSAKTKQNILLTDLLINLNLNKFRLLHSTPKQADKMINVGYLETMIRVHQMKTSNN